MMGIRNGTGDKVMGRADGTGPKDEGAPTGATPKMGKLPPALAKRAALVKRRAEAAKRMK